VNGGNLFWNPNTASTGTGTLPIVCQRVKGLASAPTVSSQRFLEDRLDKVDSRDSTASGSGSGAGAIVVDTADAESDGMEVAPSRRIEAPPATPNEDGNGEGTDDNFTAPGTGSGLASGSGSGAGATVVDTAGAESDGMEVVPFRRIEAPPATPDEDGNGEVLGELKFPALKPNEEEGDHRTKAQFRSPLQRRTEVLWGTAPHPSDLKLNADDSVLWGTAPHPSDHKVNADDSA